MALGGNSTSLESLEPSLRHLLKWLLSQAPSAGARHWRVTSARRSKTAQAALWKSYLAGRSSFPALPPELSKHVSGQACDIVTEPFEALQSLGAIWKKAGGFWTPKDPIHFELR